ncbi:MAG: hypothetical protein CMG74_12695 [Candidatus Marinimicrobia bacterium]|nr:hypothetical protein [Candidatus Neomarinimicrobiota bacterium]|tara:strand:- start:389 stop:1939 length:1551 start_codon:yes stop_codon:yes gene_type:complete
MKFFEKVYYRILNFFDLISSVTDYQTLPSVELHIKDIKIIHDMDIVVIGAGISGITAAISASRQGKKTLLIEQEGIIGGLVTAGLVTPFSMQMVTSDNTQIIKGICEELFDLLAEKNGTIKEWRDWKIPKIPVDPEIFKIVVTDLLKAEEVELLLNTSLIDAILDNNRIEKIVVHNRNGFSSIAGQFFIDCSGEAALARSCKVPTTINADVEKSNLKVISQALVNAGWVKKTEKTASMQFLISNVDFEKTYEFIKNNPNYYSSGKRGELMEDVKLFEYLWKEKGFFYFPHTESFKDLIIKERDAGRIKTEMNDYVLMDDAGLGIDGLRLNKTAIINANRVIVNPFDQKSVTQAMSGGLSVCFEIYSFLKRLVPGFEDSIFHETATMLGIRRGAQIIGNHIYTAEERMEFKNYPDVVGLACRKTKKSYEIPFSLMVPKKVNNLLVASGKTVSTDDFLPYRTKPICMILGQAAGVAAAICIDTESTNTSISMKSLQAKLIKDNVYLGDKKRIESLGLS